MKSKHLFLWCDLETTNLDPRGPEAAVLEASFCLTYPSGKLICEANTPLALPPDLSVADVWEGHLKSGLIKDCRGPGNPSSEEFDAQFGAILKGQRERTEAKVLLAGSSIHFDRGWIKHHLPTIEDQLHYRMIDVRSLLIALGSVGVDVELHQGQDKATVHRAKDDRLWAQRMFGKIQNLVGETAKRLKIARIDGMCQGLRAFAYWKNGEQLVGTLGTTLKRAIEEARQGIPSDETGCCPRCGRGYRFREEAENRLCAVCVRDLWTGYEIKDLEPIDGR